MEIYQSSEKSLRKLMFTWVVRRSRTAVMLGEGEEEDDRNLEDADLFSDTTSVGGAPSTVRTRYLASLQGSQTFCR